MSGRRPLLRSPKFGDGMTSETTEESGVNVCMSALPFGIGRARKRFESNPPDTNEPECIGRPKTGKRTTIERQWRHYPDWTELCNRRLIKISLFYQLCKRCIRGPEGPIRGVFLVAFRDRALASNGLGRLDRPHQRF